MRPALIATTMKKPLFRYFAARYRGRSRYRWKPSSLRTYDSYMRGRLMLPFGRLRLDAVDHVRVSVWFEDAITDRALEILRAMLTSARQRSKLGKHVPDACGDTVNVSHLASPQFA